jgi:hypothetical protein
VSKNSEDRKSKTALGRNKDSKSEGTAEANGKVERGPLKCWWNKQAKDKPRYVKYHPEGWWLSQDKRHDAGMISHHHTSIMEPPSANRTSPE